jgi:hypothetical protein
MSALARIERFLGWDALSPIALGGLLVSLDATIVQAVCVLVVFAQYSVKIDQIHSARKASVPPPPSILEGGG